MRTRSGRIRHWLGGDVKSLGVDGVAQKMDVECGGKGRGGNPRDITAQGQSWRRRSLLESEGRGGRMMESGSQGALSYKKG